MGTKLERSNPALTALAEQVMPGEKIHYRGKAYWLGDMQITYDSELMGGQSVALDWRGKVALAERILRGILAAQQDPELGSRWTRQRRVLIGLHDDVLPTFMRHNWCHWRHASLDDGWLFQSRLRDVCIAGIRLAREDVEDEAKAHTMESAIEALWNRLAPPRERPPWHGADETVPQQSETEP